MCKAMVKLQHWQIASCQDTAVGKEASADDTARSCAQTAAHMHSRALLVVNEVR